MLREMDASKGEPPVTESEAPKKVEEAEDEVASMTSEQFAARLDRLAASAKAAGLSPAREMVKAYGRRFLAAFDGLLRGLEGEPPKKEG